MSDRRRQNRFEVCLDAAWDGRSGNYDGRISDLSEGGCYVDTLCEAYVGEVLNFKLRLPSGEWLELRGEVAHHTAPVGFGLRFLNLTDEQIGKLHDLITYLRGGTDNVPAIMNSN